MRLWCCCSCTLACCSELCLDSNCSTTTCCLDNCVAACRFAEYYREHKAKLPIHVWRDASPQHFNTPTGDFKCDNCPDAPWPFVCEVQPWPVVAHSADSCWSCEGVCSCWLLLYALRHSSRLHSLTKPELQEIRDVRLEFPGDLHATQGVEPAEKVARGGWRNSLSNPLLAELGVPVMHTWNYSVPLSAQHRTCCSR